VDRDGLTIVMASNDPVLLEAADAVYELRDGVLAPLSRA